MNMKYLFVVCLSISPILTGQTIVDDFDDYNAGAYLGLESDGLWTTWYNNPGGEEDAFVSDEVARSAPNSIKIDNEGSDTIDVVLPLGNISSGSWDCPLDVCQAGSWSLLTFFTLRQCLELGNSDMVR